MSRLLARLAGALARLSARERVLILLLALIALPLGGWFGFAAPLLERQVAARAELAGREAEALWLTRQLSRLADLPPAELPGPAAIEAGLREAGLAGAVSSADEGTLEIRFEAVDFAALMRWLATLRGFEGLSIEPLVAGKGGEGLVRARLRLGAGVGAEAVGEP